MRTCSTSALFVNLVADPGGAAAGSHYYDVLFTNTSTKPCRIAGYPAVFVANLGTTLGPPADRPTSAPATTLTLVPRATAFSLLKVTDIGAGGGAFGAACDVATGDRWLVYAPRSTVGIGVPAPDVPACTNGPVWMHLQAPLAHGSHT